MPLTQLSELTGHEVSLVPMGANKKRRFLVTKEDGELSMDDLLEQILKEGLKDEETIDKVTKNLGLEEDEQKAFKAVMKIVSSEGSPLSKEKLMKALGAMGVSKSDEDEGDVKKAEGDDDEKKEPAKKSDDDDDKSDPVNKEATTPKGGEMSKVPVQKEDGSWDLSGVDESLRPALEAVCKSNQQLSQQLSDQTTANKSLAEKLKVETDARVLKQFEERARDMGHIGTEATKIAQILKSAYDADPANGKAVEAVLKSASDKIKESGLFNELGTSGSNGTPGAGAWDKIEKAASKFTDADPKMSHADAVDLVLKKHPELYSEYQAEKGAK